MKDKKEYEKHLAEQLNRLPAPGSAEEHWPAMKALLDRDMPEGGAAGRWKRPGNWGLMALVIGILFTAFWYFTPSATEKQKGIASPVSSVQESKAMRESQTSNTTVIPAKQESLTNRTEDPLSDDKNANLQPAASASEETEVPNDKAGTALTKAVAKAEKETENTGTENTESLPDTKKASASVPTKERTTRSSARTNRNRKNAITATALSAPAKKIRKDRSRGFTEPKSESTPSNSDFSLPDPSSGRTAKASLPAKPVRIPFAIEGVKAEDSIHNNYAYALMPEPAPAPPRSRFPKETDRTRALKNRIVGTGDNKNFVLGLTLPLALPINDQKTVAYNFNGGLNKITDYIPVPHVQYHFNERAFLQTELHFFAPQYIKSALVFQETKPMSGGNFPYKTTSIYTEKLYYFSVPVSAYYSPFRNFYLGTGVQFSSLLSGIARYEEKGTNAMGPAAGGQVLSNSYKKFRNDNVSALLNGNEFRVLLDANYYYKKFTLGMRYNQALGNYVGLQVNAFTPYYSDRNKSLQFYLRYNLWENLKKKPAIMAYRW